MSDEVAPLDQELAQFERAVAAGVLDDARVALRRYLFFSVDSPVKGSATEAVEVVAQAPGGRAIAAAVVVRALGAGVLQNTGGGHLARHVISLAEGALPEFCAFLG